MKKKLTVREILQEMITTHTGSISSKIIIGAITYLFLTAAVIGLMFINPGFPGLTEIVSILILTSSSLLGLTTIENLKQKKNYGKTED